MEVAVSWDIGIKQKPPTRGATADLVLLVPPTRTSADVPPLSMATSKHRILVKIE